MSYSETVANDLRQTLIDHIQGAPGTAPGGTDEVSILGDHAAGLILEYYGGAVTADDIALDLKSRVPDFPVEDFLMRYGML